MTFTYTGTSGNDNYTYKGSDSLLAYGLAGNDTLSRAYYSVNNATLIGGAGNDDLSGYGNDILIGGVGDDRLLGVDDAILIGGAGNDTIDGDGDVILRGGAGNDWLRGGKGSDDSTLIGGVGDDTLWDSTGNNYLAGGMGNDLLWSSIGNDTLTGGTGADIFQLSSFSQSNEYATITDFRRAQGDKIQVSGSASNYYLDKSQNLSGQLALDTAIYYSNTLIAVLQDTIIASLSSDFIFG